MPRHDRNDRPIWLKLSYNLDVFKLTLMTILLFAIGHSAMSSQDDRDTVRGITEYRLTDASRSFDFVIRIRAHIPEELDGYCEGPGSVLILKKGALVPFQTITLDNIFVSLDQDGKPLRNSAHLYGDQGLINAGDFNFDGHEDFAIQTGNGGSYGSPSYRVYLYTPSQTAFQFSSPMSSLIEQTLGFFHVDSARKRLVTLNKSGCCFHETVEYKVENNLPVPISRVVEDATRKSGYVYVSHEQFVKGKWRGTTKRVPEEPDEDEPKAKP